LSVPNAPSGWWVRKSAACWGGACHYLGREPH
jgi:hypothetical protein